MTNEINLKQAFIMIEFYNKHPTMTRTTTLEHCLEVINKYVDSITENEDHSQEDGRVG